VEEGGNKTAVEEVVSRSVAVCCSVLMGVEDGCPSPFSASLSMRSSETRWQIYIIQGIQDLASPSLSMGGNKRSSQIHIT